MPLMKGTGFALFPAIALALLAALVQRRSRTALLGVVATAAGFAIVTGIWALLRAPLRPGRAASTGRHDPVHQQWDGWRHQRRLGRIGEPHRLPVEVFVPKLPFAYHHFIHGFWPFGFIYIDRGFAAFGWYADFFPLMGLQRRALDMVACACGRDDDRDSVAAVRRRWREALFLLL